MRRRFATVLTALTLMGLFGTAALAVAPAADRDLGGRLVEGVANRQFLWVRNSSGGVVRFDLATGARRKLNQRLADIALWQGRPVGLRAEANSRRYAVIDLDTGKPLAPVITIAKGERPNLVVGEGLAVLTEQSLWLWREGWTRRSLGERLGFGQITTAWHPRHGILVGQNRGEWCGGLLWIDPATGRQTKVERQEGQFEPSCEAVTALVADREQPDCLLAAVGLSHFMADGGVLRVCGARSSVVFRRAVPEPPPPPPGADEDEEALVPLFDNFWPIFDMTATADGWVAISQGRLFRYGQGAVSESDLPPLSDWHGLPAAFVGEDLIMLRTDANARFSLSGETPLLVARPR